MKTSKIAAGLSRVREAAGRPEEAPATAQPTQDVPPSRVGKVAISAYFDKAVRKQLANLATDEEKSQAALMAEALNLLFEKYRKPPIARA